MITSGSGNTTGIGATASGITSVVVVLVTGIITTSGKTPVLSTNSGWVTLSNSAMTYPSSSTRTSVPVGTTATTSGISWPVCPSKAILKFWFLKVLRLAST